MDLQFVAAFRACGVSASRADRDYRRRAVRVVVPMRCARLRALGVGGLRRHGDHRCDLHGGGPCVGPGAEIEIGDL